VFLACRHFSLRTDLYESKDQSCFKVQIIPLFYLNRLICICVLPKMCSRTPHTLCGKPLLCTTATLNGTVKSSCPLRMVSSGLLRRVALVRTDVSEEPGASFSRVTKIGIPLGISSQHTSVASCSLCCS
jgi:hypothetical protein